MLLRWIERSLVVVGGAYIAGRAMHTLPMNVFGAAADWIIRGVVRYPVARWTFLPQDKERRWWLGFVLGGTLVYVPLRLWVPAPETNTELALTWGGLAALAIAIGLWPRRRPTQG